MAHENVEAVRRLFEAYPHTQERLRRGEAPIGEPFAEDVEWDASETRLPDLGDGRLHGREGVRRFWMAWLAAWEEVAFDYELRDAGDRVVALIDQRMHARDTMSLAFRHAEVWTFRDGRVVHWKLYMDDDAGLRAAGLLE